MKAFVLLAYEFISSFIPFLIVLVIYAQAQKKQGAALTTRTTVPLIALTLYVTCVFHVTGAGTLYDALRYRLALSPDQINLLLFSKDIDPVGYCLNIVLFLPLGILMPLLLGDRRPFLFTAGTGVAFSLLIEISQLLNNRRTDIDDLVLNTIGAILGFALYRVWNRYRKPKGRRESVSMSAFIISYLVPFLGRFLFFNEMGLARLLYGF